jgi:hypothetical protein
MRDCEFFLIIENSLDDLQFTIGNAKSLGDYFPCIVRKDRSITIAFSLAEFSETLPFVLVRGFKRGLRLAK